MPSPEPDLDTELPRHFAHHQRVIARKWWVTLRFCQPYLTTGLALPEKYLFLQQWLIQLVTSDFITFRWCQC